MGIAATLFELRSSVFGSKHPRDPALADWFGGGESVAAGVEVTRDTAVKNSAFFCAILLLSNSMKSLPLQVFRRVASGKERLTNHPVDRLLHRSPSPEMTPGKFKAFLQSSAMLWGGGFAEIQRDGAGRPMNLWAIHPSRVYADRNTDGRIEWVVQNDGKPSVRIPDDDMLHLFQFTKDGVTGVSLVKVAAEALGVAIAAERFGASWFANGARPGGILTHPGELDDDAIDRMRTSWMKFHSGTENTNRPAILESGVTWTSVGLPPEDSQLLQLREFSVEEVARFTNIPPHKLKDLRRATFSNIEHQEIQYVSEAVLPWAIDLEEECNKKLFTEREAGTLFCEMQLAGLMRADSRTRAEYHKTLHETGVVTVNEIRSLENMNQVGETGDIRILPMNFTTVESIAQGRNLKTEPPKTNTRGLPAARAVVRDAAGRAVSKLVDRITRSVKKFAGDEEGLRGWVDTFLSEQADGLRSTFGASVRCYGESAGIEVADANEIVSKLIDSIRSDVAGAVDIRAMADGWHKELADRMTGIVIEQITGAT